MTHPLEWSYFKQWFTELCKLRLFWAKPYLKLEELEVGGSWWLVRAEWAKAKRARGALMAAAKSSSALNECLEALRGHLDGGYEALLIAPECLELELRRLKVDALSMAYFWDLDSLTLLEPSYEVEVEALEAWGPRMLEEVASVHRRSWGFTVEPRPGDHVVLLARLHGDPVGAAFLNLRSGNIDYGVHVVREHWRRRVGTRLLHEACRQAAEVGLSRLSVVRWLRSVRLSSSDRRG